MSSYVHSWSKRLLDLLLSVLLLPVAIPLIVLGSFAIVITTGQGFLFTQRRVGKGGKEFTMYKLRTLKKGARSDLSGMRPNDPDIIGIGRVLRLWRIDELPQIFNIFSGHMSWVGPRPERPHIVARCVESIPHYRDRHQVLPGITGWAQVHNPNATPEDNALKLEHDLEYVHSATLAMDLKILWRTLVAIG